MTTTGTWYPPSLGAGGFLLDFTNPPFAMTDPVNHPRHYNAGPMSTDAVRAALQTSVTTFFSPATKPMTLTKNTEQLKQRVAEHIAADSIVQGSYWSEETKRGCFIGCLAHSDDPRINEAVYGLPIAVQRIAENIFESLPHAEAKAFFAALPGAVGCDGKDLSKVHWQFLAAELRALPPQTDEIQAVIAPVIAGMDMVATGQKWPGAAHAADAAFSAANASYAATATATAIAAATAAVAAATAAVAATAIAAATAVNAAANAANAAGVRLRQRDLLLQLIKEAPVIDSTPAKGVLRIILNRHVVDLVRAVLAKWGRQ